MSLVNIAIGSNIHQANVVGSPEQLERLVQAAVSGAVQQHAAEIAELSTKLGATQAALLAILRALGHDDVPAERLPEMFVSAVTQIVTMREALSPPSNAGSDLAKLRQQVLFALDAGRFDEATRLLNEIRTQERATSERRRRAADESRADWLAGLQSEAETCALLARAALAQRDVGRAFDRFEEGLGVLGPTDAEHRWSYALTAAGALYDLGSLAGLNDALTESEVRPRLAGNSALVRFADDAEAYTSDPDICGRVLQRGVRARRMQPHEIIHR
jgi:hypothetical protein